MGHTNPVYRMTPEQQYAEYRRWAGDRLREDEYELTILMGFEEWKQWRSEVEAAQHEKVHGDRPCPFVMGAT